MMINLLFIVRLNITWQNGTAGHRLSVAGGRNTSLARKTLTRTRRSGGRLSVMMS